ncbi:fumarylacetoacetate hydrolase family protein [Actinomadura barringtoniae]|uniref:Fumarylacetoacetate hydrolase family protein n=1 Tax=Actinomadura barringtoniae TaxID=1427535 RepID=A0A939PS68_9ACTN|nr:fumarylacetoacetate hydrolase family protein [Actinomadura barringtoniae]MBO2455283.1 fumarylacetoacetate hydrolase family protein [Actinomadura barringtoniae]
MRLVAYLDRNGAEALGRLDGTRVHRLPGLGRIDRRLSPKALTPKALTPEALAAMEPADEGVELDELTLLPVARPEKIFCVGLNYRSHVDETGRDLPTYPVLFPKFASSLIGHGAPITLPPESVQVDYEAELAVVIGKPGRRISRDDAFDHVLGYTICNDVTMRDYQYKTHQWMQGKAWDGSTPLGPVLVTADELDADGLGPGRLGIALRLNGAEMQSATTDRLIFDVPELIRVTSEFTRLEAGDVILTGTPGGVGYRRDPQVFLTDGDIVEVEIEGIGTLRNTVRAES